MGKTLKYVSEFSFPSDKGYSGSAGQQMVKGYARGGSCGYAKGGKMERLKDVIGNERKEMTRVEAKQRDAGQELSRVRSEMRYDKNEMKGMRKQYPVDRREPMVAMKKGGHVSKKIMKKFDGGYIQDPASSGFPQNTPGSVQLASPLTQISNYQTQPSLSPTAMKKGGHVGKKLVKMANGGQILPHMARPNQVMPRPPVKPAPPQPGYQPRPSTPSLPTSRPNVDPAFLEKAVASAALPPPRPSTLGRPGTPPPRSFGISVGVPGTPTYKYKDMTPPSRPVTPPPGQINPSRPNVMGFPDMPTQQQMQSMRGQPNVMGSPEMSMQRQLQDASRREMLESMRDAQGNPLPLQQRIALNEAAQAQQQMQSMRGQPNVMGFPDMPTQQQSQSGGQGGQPLGVASFGMGRPGGPVNTGGLGQGGMSPFNTTTQSDIRGGNRRPMGGFNPADMMQGLQQFAGRNNPPQIGPNQPMAPSVQRPLGRPPQVQQPPRPQQMGQPAMAKGGMLYSKKEVSAKNLLGDGKAPPMPHAKGSVNMAKGGMTSKQTAKVGKVMGEFKAGELHSGSKSGPVVKSRKQAIAIGLSEARKAKK